MADPNLTQRTWPAIWTKLTQLEITLTWKLFWFEVADRFGLPTHLSVDTDFGRLQAGILLEHLRTGRISNTSVDVFQGTWSIEVRPVGVTKVHNIVWYSGGACLSHIVLPISLEVELICICFLVNTGCGNRSHTARSSSQWKHEFTCNLHPLCRALAWEGLGSGLILLLVFSLLIHRKTLNLCFTRVLIISNKVKQQTLKMH